MGKALVLKNGVDFSANAVTTIEFADIPCTGITFAQNTYTISGYNNVTVEYTVSPIDTTDSIVWTSSDDTVVSVSGGVMTVNGIGTCTVTATCGGFTATAVVTVNIAYIPNWEFRAINTDNEFISYGAATYNRLFSFGVGRQASEYNIVSSASKPVSSSYAIKIPNNTARIRISRDASEGSSFYNSSSYHIICWLQDVSCGSETFPNAAKNLSNETFNPVLNATTEFAIPENANCFVVVTRLNTTYTSSDDANTVASDLGLTIEFLPAE